MLPLICLEDVMNKRFKKAAAIAITVFMLCSLSACSKQDSGLSGQGLGGENKQEQSESANKDDEGALGGGIESVESMYSKGIDLLKSGKYVEAEGVFAKCGDYQCSPDLIRVCQAENEFSKGHYESAKAYYSQVSDNAETPGFPIKAKKANLDTRITLTKMAGTYYPTYNRITMDKYKKKRKQGSWYSIGVWGDQFVSATFIENDDGTFDVTGEVQFMRYTKFAKKKSGIKKGAYKLPLSLKGISQFPAKVTLAKGVTLQYKNGLFYVNYSKTSKSGKTKVVYKSAVTYKKSQ